MLSGNSLRQTAYAYRASVHQAAKLVAVLLRVGRVTVGLAESYGSLLLGVWLVTCRLTAKNRDQLQNPMLWCQVWATFLHKDFALYFLLLVQCSRQSRLLFSIWTHLNYFVVYHVNIIFLSSACRWHCKMLLGDVVHYGTWWHQSTTEQYIWYQCL